MPSALETTLFEARLSSTWPKYLVDHQVQGSPVVPAAAYVELGLAAAEQAFGPGEHIVENVSIQHAMFLPEGAGRVVQVTLAPEMAGERTFDVYSVPGDCKDAAPSWALHACGKLRPADPKQGDAKPPSIDLDEVRSRTVDATQRQELYEQMAARGLAYGPAFQVLDDLRRTDRDALAEVRLAPTVAEESAQYHLHPALLDACFQSMAGAVPLERDGSYSPFTYMPTQVRHVRIYGKPVGRMFTYAARTSQSNQPSPETVDGDVCLLDEKGQVLVELIGVRVQRFGRSRLHDRKVDVRDWLYRVGWQSQPLEEPTAQTRQGSWLIFADTGGVAATLAENLRQQGNRCIVVSPDNAFASTATDPACDDDTYRIDPLSGKDYQRLLGEVLGKDAPKCLGIVHLWSLDVPTPKRLNTQGLDDARRLGCGSVLRLLQQLARSAFAEPPSVWLVTQGAQAVVDDAEAVAVGQAALWGMGRVAAMEFPESRCRLVDVDPAVNPASNPAAIVSMLAAELAAEADEDQIAYRGTDRYVARLEPTPTALKTDDQSQGLTVPREGPFRLRLGAPGSFNSLRFESFARRQPAAGQVEIEVHAAGLNFSDVLKALGLYPGITDEVVPLGIECSGVITAVGSGVDRFKPGDEVMGVAPYSFASHVITAEYTLAPKPKRIDHDEAATVPVTFMTAYYALCRLAHLRPAERVLIHAGAGGVGLAAIQIAQNVGAEIFATAGSDRKRDFLRELGVQHVMSSRTLDFHDEIMRITDRQGVDVVLNSLPGDAITKSLASLRAYGRFLEIGKTDIYQNRMIGLLPFQDNLSYFAIDLDRMLRQRPDEIRELFAELMSHFEAGVYGPLPLTRFPVEDTVGAFRYMTQRKNIGKVVVSLEDRQAETADTQPSDTLVRQDGTYLITGGSGALGLQVAGWLAAQGAQHLVLMSRRAASGNAAEALDAVRKQGISVAAVQGDVTDSESVAAALAQIPAEMPPLRGVVHAAGVLDDGVMFDMDLDRLDKAMAPKVQGAWNLHAATLDASLDFFVLFSSVACVLGSPGQANYAAGNAFLDGLAHYRRAQGLPAMSVNWGPWAGSGMAVEAGRGGQIRARGMDLIPPETGLKVLGGLMRAGAANVAVMDVHWPDLLKLMPRRKPTLLRDLAAKEGEQTTGAEGSKVNHEFRQKLLSVDLPERTALLQDYFVDELARIMGIEPASLDVQQPLNMLGLDSLMAIELKTNLETQLMFDLPMARFLESPSVVTLAGHAAESIVNGAAASDAPSSTDSPETDQQPTSYEDRAPVGASAESNAARPRPNGAAAAWSPLVGMQRDGGKPALFCVHPVGGDVRCYYYLARNKKLNRPVYALRARGMDASIEPHHSMDEMVDDYLRSIREVQPEGPFHLAGWSTGGIFAYEMARRLAEEGVPAGMLALFDSPMPSIFSNVDLGDDARFLYDLVNFANWFAGAKMSVSYDELHSQGPEQRLETVLHEAKRHRVVPADVSADHIRRLIEVCKTHVRIVMDYTPVPFQQHLHIFRPMDTSALSEASGQSVDQDLGWGSVVGQNLTLREVPGNHFSMMTGENADQLAELLANCLQQTCVEHAGETVQSD
ncbi:MAG: hypothetical protein A2V70_10225 [Planctomycetes bacterium RBG_13_63_9]|nr:MAG: hypothetical protein A2V70_10225 [Planctomycetes bacterium RBG_13_63_9]